MTTPLTTTKFSTRSIKSQCRPMGLSSKLLLLIVVFIFIPMRVQGEQLDQSFIPSVYNVGIGIRDTTFYRGQTFTVAQSGILSRVAGFINNCSPTNTADIIVTIRAGVDFTNPPLAVGTIPASAIPFINGCGAETGNTAIFAGADINSAGLFVMAGEIYTMWLHSSNLIDEYGWWGDSPSTYAGGTARTRTSGGGHLDFGFDVGFATYVSSQPSPPGLVSWWDGDLVSETTAFDIVNGNNGTLVNGATTGAGKVGNAFSFDGIDDFVQVPDSDLWTFGSNDFSIDLWANFSTVDTGSRDQLRNVFVGHDGAQPPFFTVNKWIFHYAENGLFFHIFDMMEGIPIFLGPFPFTPVVGQFHHFAVTRNGSTYTFYADGDAIGSTIDSRPIPNATAPLTIGQSEGAGFFHGLIDEVQIYNRALSGEEIRNIFLDGAAPDSTPPHVSCGASDGAWHSSNVSIACTASDPESGLANPADANFNLTTNVLAGTETANGLTNTREICNTVDGCIIAGPINGNKVDRKAPSITVTSPVTNATYQLTASVAASYACADSGSGVASCQGPVANGSPIDTSSTGTKTFTVTSTDNVGNPASATVTYSVVSGGGGGATSADVGITLSAPSRVSPGGSLTYSMIVSNAGKVTATGTVVSNALPAGTVFASATASQGTIGAPPVGSNGTVSVNIGSLANGAKATINIVTTVMAAPDTVLTDTATVTATTQDLNSTNNSATQKTTVAKK